jgi:hypothetical protein
MKKILIVEECAECYYCYSSGGHSMCSQLDRIVDPLSMPEDCPLSDLEEK